MEIIVYKITNLINNKLYVGITKQSLKSRLNQHFSNDYPIGKAMKKYGKENFKIEILETVDNIKDALEKETNYISMFNTSITNNQGYNIITNSTCGEFTDFMKLNIVHNLKIKKRKTGLYVGVYQIKSTLKWSFSISLMGKTKTGKGFETAYDAAIARDINLVKLFDESECKLILNFPDLYNEYMCEAIPYPERKLKKNLKHSKFKFVNYEKKASNWRVKVTDVDGNKISLGTFSNEVDAAIVADFFNFTNFKNESILNFPENVELYKDPNFKIPKSVVESIKQCPFKNIGYEIQKGKTVGYRIYIETKGKTYRSYYKTLDDAIKERNKILNMIGRKIPD